MACTDCNDNVLGNFYVFENQEGHCENCGSSDNVCRDKLDARCVVYHLGQCEAVSTLPNLGIDSCDNLQVILEKLDALLGSTANIPLVANDSLTIDFTQSGPAAHTFTGNVKVSTDQDNLLTVRANGLYALPGYKSKVDALDTPAYLEDQFEPGTDPLGIVSISITKVAGKLRITPTIDLEALCTALQDAGCLCGSPDDLEIT